MARLVPVAYRHDKPIACKPTPIGNKGKMQTAIPVRRYAYMDPSDARYEYVEGVKRRKADYGKPKRPKYPTRWSSWL